MKYNVTTGFFYDWNEEKEVYDSIHFHEDAAEFESLEEATEVYKKKCAKISGKSGSFVLILEKTVDGWKNIKQFSTDKDGKELPEDNLINI